MVGRRGGAWAIVARLARPLMASHPPPHLPLRGGKDRKTSYLLPERWEGPEDLLTSR